MAKKTEKTTHICSECIGEFEGKDLYEALVESIIDSINCKYYTIFCEKCIKKLKITDYTPYYKSRTKESTAKTKKDTVAKTKKDTTIKTKKDTAKKNK